jgi:hypothetical protein
VVQLGLPLEKLFDLAVDTGQPHRTPHAQGAQPLQVWRQIIEHIVDSRLKVEYATFACSILCSIT